MIEGPADPGASLQMIPRPKASFADKALSKSPELKAGMQRAKGPGSSILRIETIPEEAEEDSPALMAKLSVAEERREYAKSRMKPLPVGSSGSSASARAGTSSQASYRANIANAPAHSYRGSFNDTVDTSGSLDALWQATAKMVPPSVAARTKAKLTMKKLPSGNAQSLESERGSAAVRTNRSQREKRAAAASHRGSQPSQRLASAPAPAPTPAADEVAAVVASAITVVATPVITGGPTHIPTPTVSLQPSVAMMPTPAAATSFGEDGATLTQAPPPRDHASSLPDFAEAPATALRRHMHKTLQTIKEDESGTESCSSISPTTATPTTTGSMRASLSTANSPSSSTTQRGAVPSGADTRSRHRSPPLPHSGDRSVKTIGKMERAMIGGPSNRLGTTPSPTRSRHTSTMLNSPPSNALQGLLDRQPGVAPFNRLQGEYQKFVQRQDASRIQDAARAAERRQRDNNEELLRTENARLKAEVAELKAKLLVVTSAASPPADKRFAPATHFVQAVAGSASIEGLQALNASMAVAGELQSPTQVAPQPMTSTLEAIRLHDLLVHRQRAAARSIQLAYRAHRDKKRSRVKMQQRESTKADITSATASSASREGSRLLGPRTGSSRGDLLRSDRSASSGRIRSGLMQSDRSEASDGRFRRHTMHLQRGDRDEQMGRKLAERETDYRRQTSMLNRFVMERNAFAAGGRTKEATSYMKVGRLDRHIGEPSPAIFNAMEREHASEILFSSDMEKDTTPLSEWRYVTDEEVGSRSDRTHDCTPERVGWRLDDFVRSDRSREANLTREEVIAVRLYTGPMSDLYNTALRQRSNTYVTTIHAFNSALVKLSRVQMPTTVYRVMTVPDDPTNFFTPDAFGTCDAFEPGFFSATASKSFALQLLREKRLHEKPRGRSRSANESTIVLRIRVIPTDQVGNVSFASQSPLDEEIVFTALSTFEVVELHSSDSLNSTIAELRPHRGPMARTIDQVIGKMKRMHLELLDMMIDELRAAGSPEPSLLPLNTLRTKRSDLEDSSQFNKAAHFLDFTKIALDTHVRVLDSLTHDASWRGERGTKEDVAKRMLAIVALQARAGEHEIAIAMTKLALQRANLSITLRSELEDKERYAAAVTTNQSKGVIKPSQIGKLFPPSQHSILEGAIYFLSLGVISPWPALMAALLAKMNKASHIVFGELIRAREGQRILGLEGTNVFVMPGKGMAWERGIKSHSGAEIRVGRNVMNVIPSLRILLPTDAGVGALLNEAAARGDEALVHTLIRANVDLRYCDERANSALHRAVLGGHAKVCQTLMESRADPMIKNMDGLSSWDLALCGGRGSVRRVFSPSCVDIDSMLGATPAASVSDFQEQKEQVKHLLAASMRGDASRIKYLLDHARPTMPIIDVPNLMLVTPLMFAALAPDGDQAVQVLLRAKAGILHLTQHSSSVLSMSAQAGTLKTAKALLESNASLLMDQCDDQGYTPLHVAVENGHGDVAKMLINAGAKVTIPRKNGWTCLMSAAFFGSADIIEDLVHRGGNVNAPFVYTTQRDVTGALHHATYRPVHLAAFNGFAETISMLGKLGADVNAYMGSGWTPLMIAAAQGHTAAVGALIEMRADIDYQNPLDGVSALMTAASHGTSPACLGLLLQAKANVHLQDDRGCDTLMRASRLGHAHSVQQLLLQRANPRYSRVGGATALMDAAASGSDEVVELLVNGGSDVGAADEQGRTALIFAAKAGHELCLLPLLRVGPHTLHRTDKTRRTAIAYAATTQVSRRLLEAGASSAQLPQEICAMLGLPPQEGALNSHPSNVKRHQTEEQQTPGYLHATDASRGNTTPPRGPSTGRRDAIRSSRRDQSARSSVASSRRDTAESPPRSQRSLSPPKRPSSLIDERDRKTPWVVQELRADEQDKRSLSSALSPLVLEPTIAESAPLLKVFARNATPLQTGGAIIIQRRFRNMRARRFRAASESLYMPRGVGLKGSIGSVMRKNNNLKAFPVRG